MEYIVQMKPSFDEMEKKAVNAYLETDAWLMEFKKAREFEKMLAEYTMMKYCSVMPNGTLSLSLALVACGVTKGDEIIVPDFTMVATPNSVEMIGAKAVFADIERDTLCIELSSIKRKINNKTKAVIIVSINGRYPSNIEEIVQFCHNEGLYVIEDAAQSLGSFYKGKHVGSYGDIASFSFSVPKIITMGQGGALVTNNKELYEKILLVRDFGREKAGEDHYITMGWNYKITDLQAVIGIEQMKKLPWRVERKRELGKIYIQNLEGIDGVELISTDLSETTPWFYDILCEDREKLVKFLNENGIGSRRFYPALHSEPVYNYNETYLVSEEIAKKGLWLPSWIDLKEEQIIYITEVIRKFYKER